MSRKLESLVGQKFGKLIVIGESIFIKRNSYSLCKCDCGNEKLIRNTNLKCGKTKSCGCLRHTYNNAENLIGQRFGKLTVIGEPIAIKKYGHSLCKCDCGNEKIIRNNGLKTGNTKSCGCIYKYKKAKDFVGKKFGKLTVIGKSEKINKAYYALCKCDCGNEKKIQTQQLLKGSSKTCGLCNKKIPKRLKTIFLAMKRRCLNEKSEAYKDYGGKGVKIYKEWLENRRSVYSWALENGYDDNLSIDRINVNGNYEPSNCRWATITDQANNKRNNLFLTHGNEKKTFSQWCEIYKINRSTAQYRYKKGLPFEEIFEINKDGE